MWLEWLFLILIAVSAQFRECVKKKQSPIDINKHNCKPCPSDIKELEFLHYWDVEGKTTIVNTGDTVKVNIEFAKDIPTLRGGPLDGCYELMYVHFHWGTHDDIGSEHTINGRRFSMEVHFVHQKKEYNNDEDVEKQDNCIAVLAFFLQVGCSNDNDLMQPLVNLLCDVTECGNSADMKTEDFLKMFQEKSDSSDYFTYLGSLTTEPYTENVIWIINPKPILVSHSQVVTFRKLRDADGRCNKEHFRQVQPLNGRCVFYCSPNAETRCDRSP